LLLLIIVAGDDAHMEKTWGKLMEAGDVLEQVELEVIYIFFIQMKDGDELCFGSAGASIVV
jgi:hypothetical protein